VFYTTRASIPDVAAPSPAAVAAAAAAGPGGLHALVLRFDSLKSLPTRLPPHMAAPPAITSGAEACKPGPAEPPPPLPLPLPALHALAAYLRASLGLSLFGFDIVVAAGGGEWLVVVSRGQGWGGAGVGRVCGAARPLRADPRPPPSATPTPPPPPTLAPGRQLLPQLQGRPARDARLAARRGR
jgi:hypothetical protein